MIRIYFDAEKCVGCHSCSFACAVEHSASKEPAAALLEDPRPLPRRRMVIVKGKHKTICCQHCKKPKCVEACPNKAFVQKASGEVKLLTEKCAGVFKCIEACPFDAVFKAGAVAVKCDMCPDRPEGEFACVEACPTEALFAATPEEYKKISAAKREKKKGTAAGA